MHIFYLEGTTMNKKITHMLCLSAVSLSLFAGCGASHEKAVSEEAVSADGVCITTRTAGHPINKLILHRWSARAFSDAPVTDQELNQLFEAARWAPSSYNSQPWVFVYAKRGTPAWDTFKDLMVDFNKSWTHNAGALVVIASREKSETGRPMHTHSFDTGAAWQNLALQATSMGLIAHGMSGFDYAKAKEALHIPDGYAIEAMVAVGRPGSLENLPEELRARETPSDRKPVESFAFEGSFPIAE